MARQDLLALTDDDLAAMTNRGTVKRARRELAAGEPSAKIEETDGRVRIEWSDGVICEFPAEGTVADATCSSGAIGISRHVIRSVLAYQVGAATGDSTEESEEAGGDEKTPPAPLTEPWDPGRIPDEDLIARFGKRSVTKALKGFEQGVLAELIRGPKPFVRFLDRPCVVRFLVPSDIRYVHSDCAESALSEFVCHAVWAFRRLAPEATSGIVSTQDAPAPVPADLLDHIEELLRELCVDGIGGVSGPWKARLSRAEKACRDEGLIWPAELIADILDRAEAYASHDARFDPFDLTRFVGELLIRIDAIRSGQKAVPPLLVRGSASDRPMEIGGSRLIGVGCEARTGKGTTTITAFLQDADTGVMTAYDRVFADPAEDDAPPRLFHQLAGHLVYKGTSLATFGSGQLLIKSGKRTPSHRLALPRTAAAVAVNPQSFAWEHLRPPHFVESFAEAEARLALLPPASLRPRRPTEDVFIVPARAAREVHFDPVAQQLSAIVEDLHGRRALLQHPFTTRGEPGFECLARELSEHAETLRFISARMTRSRRGLEIRPLSLVFEEDQRRYAVQPWVDAPGKAPPSVDSADIPHEVHPPVSDFRRRWHEAVSDLLVTGADRLSPSAVRAWKELAGDAPALGFVRIATLINRFADELGRREQSLQWESPQLAGDFLQQASLLALMDDLLV